MGYGSDLRAESRCSQRCTGKGEEFWHAGAQGLTLIDEENIRVPPLDIHLLGMLWWDSAEKKFHGMECVNQNPHACEPKAALNDVTITWDGKQLTINEIQTSPTGKKSQWHETYSNITPTSFLQVGESGRSAAPSRKLCLFAELGLIPLALVLTSEPETTQSTIRSELLREGQPQLCCDIDRRKGDALDGKAIES